MTSPRQYRGVLLTVAYEGTAFSGWASQKSARTVRTVEDVLRGAIQSLDRNARGPRGASRTDAGVHAQGQLAAFDTTLELPARGWVLALNQHMPDDACIRAARIVSAGYNPRLMSRMKRYRYSLVFDKVRDPSLRHSHWRIGYEVDIEAMTREASAIVGTHDFAAFRAAGDTRATTTRTLMAVTVAPSPSDSRVWTIAYEGTAFLYNMVRILTGTLVDVGRGHLPKGTIARALHGKNRALAGQTAPAHGLVLEHIDVDLPGQVGESWPP